MSFKDSRDKDESRKLDDLKSEINARGCIEVGDMMRLIDICIELAWELERLEENEYEN